MFYNITKPMANRISVFSLAYQPFVGGAEIAVKEISDRLGDFQFSVFTHKFNKDWREYEKNGSTEIFRLTPASFAEKIAYVFKAWLAAEKEHRKAPFRAIWGVMAAYAGFAALLFKIRHPKIPFILTLQEGDTEDHILKRVGILYPFWQMVFKKADRIQVISNYLADFARRHGATCPIEVVPNGADVTRASVIKKPRKSGKNRSKVVITTSRLVRKNGVDTILAAANLLKTKAEFWILGEGPERSLLELQAAGLNVKFLGHVEPSEVLPYLAGADVFARPSRSEGLGNSFLEAMSVGLPIIGTPVGGIPDFLKDGETGLFVKVEDPKDLAQKIDLLLTDKKLHGKLSRNGKKLVSSKYSWDKIAGDMGAIFASSIK